MTDQSNKTELKHEFLSVLADNSFIANISSPRSVMHSSHMASRVNIINPDRKIVLTGIETEFGKYIDDVRTEEDITVKAVIPKRREYGELNPETILLVEFERDSEIWLDLIKVPSTRSNHGVFGYPLHPSDALKEAVYNTTIPKDTILATTDSYHPDGSYMYGVLANVALMSHPSVSEDGFAVSRSFLKKGRHTAITKRVIYLNKGDIPLNLNGDNDVYKFIPSIGEKVRSDGLLCAVRKENKWLSIVDQCNDGLREVDHTFDESTYVPIGSVVVDIEVLRGNYGKSLLTPQMTENLDREAEALINFYTDIVRQYEKILYEKKRLLGDEYRIRQTGRLCRFIADCMIKRDSVKNRYNLCSRKIKIDQYRIEVTCMSVMEPNMGSKFTDIAASKGVVCSIMEDHEMPVDENGVRADVIAGGSDSTGSRMNWGRIYEHYLGAFSRDNQSRLVSKFTSKYGPNFINHLTREDELYVLNYVRGMYSHINSESTYFIDTLPEENISSQVKEYLTELIRIFYPPDNERNILDVIESIEKSEYKPHYGPVTYTDTLGKRVTTKDNVRIGVMYLLELDKTGDAFSAVSSSKVNSFNFPIKGGKADKYKYPHSLTPTTTMSETEVRIMSSFAKPELLAELLDVALNPVTHKSLIKQILESKEPFSSNLEINRTSEPYGQTKPLMLLKHMFNAAGFDFEYKE